MSEETITPLLREACGRAGVATGDVGVMVVAGNTTMLHLLAGVDPTPMGVYPFRPSFLGHRVYAPRDLRLEFGDGSARVHLLPGPAAYVGADLAAGMVATGMIYDDGPVLLIDVGTNGEIIAKAGGRLVGCATAAGPAFEGAGLTSGMRAVRGAIERIRHYGGPLWRRAWAHRRSRAAARHLRLGLRGLPLGGAARGGPAGKRPVRRTRSARGRATRSRWTSQGRKLLLHAMGASGPIWISELDIARLLQAKAAIAAGTTTLLGMLGVAPREVKRVYLAGGFGFHLSLEHAIGCGLLPGFEPGQIQVVGNTSLGGAFLALNDQRLVGEMVGACAAMEVIELNLQPGFEDAFIDQLALP